MGEIVTDRKILRQTSRETTAQEVEQLKLISRLREANSHAWCSGAGLAAIQIGVPVRFAWYKFKDHEGTLLNPKIVQRYGVIKEKEGCLSIPNKYTEVERAYEIDYLTNGKKKNAKGFLARLIQHEIDHMDGILNDEKSKATQEFKGRGE